MQMRQQRQELMDIAARIVHRQQRGQFEVAAKLIVRALATSDADLTFAFALALAEQALIAVEDDRVNAAEQGMQWRPAMMEDEQLVTADSTTVSPVALAMRLIEAMHRSMDGEPNAVAEIGEVYEVAAVADDAVFQGMFAALASYAAHALNDEVRVLNHDAATCGHVSSS